MRATRNDPACPDAEGDEVRYCLRCSFIRARNAHFLDGHWWIAGDDPGTCIQIDDCDMDEDDIPIVRTLHSFVRYGACIVFVCDECGYETEEDLDDDR